MTLLSYMLYSKKTVNPNLAIKKILSYMLFMDWLMQNDLTSYVVRWRSYMLFMDWLMQNDSKTKIKFKKNDSRTKTKTWRKVN